MYSTEQLSALRKAYKKNLWFNLSAVFASLLFAGYMLLGEVIAFPLIGGLAAGLGVIAAIANYAIEHALHRKEKNAFFVLILCMLLPLLIFVVAGKAAGLQGSDSASFLPYFASFIFLYAAIPLAQLLRDGTHLREGNLCETVGRMKKNTHRKEASGGLETYLLFEDELTHEVHLLRASSLSPHRRYRVFYLPHSGLAVGEPIADNVTFDPFGNPIEREVTEDVETDRAPYREDESYTPKPDYDEDESYTEKPTYNDDRGYAEKPPYVEDEAEASETSYSYPEGGKPDPNSPERQKAARYGSVSKICKVLSLVGAGLLLVFSLIIGEGFDAAIGLLCLVPFILFSILHTVFKNKELKLRCTKRTTAHCIYTVRRRSGKSSHLYPVVEYEVEGVSRTAELSVTCSRDAVGETYVIYYNPLDPSTVRAE